MGLSNPVSHARLQIRRYCYRGENGFLLSGRDHMGRKVSIFTTVHEKAERMRQNIRAGRDSLDNGA